VLLQHWSENLGKLAQTWSNECQFKHGNPAFEASIVGFYEVGGNLWASEESFNAGKVVDSWFKDQANFSEETQNCLVDKICSSYKQVSATRIILRLTQVRS
jgi:hypothetical protein